MFTGIVESMGQITDLKYEGRNKIITISSQLTPELKVDQSISHNGVCLTVERINLQNNQYQITAIEETLKKTTLDDWVVGDHVNLERSVTLEQRLDGHLVQGHVDGTTVCTDIKDRDGSMFFTFRLSEEHQHLVIPQGSVTLDGISLTIAELSLVEFSVAIIPYTFEHTNAQTWQTGKAVNVEFDVFGKYLERYRELYKSKVSV